MDRVEDLRVVAFGGGTGLPVLLRGVRDRVRDLTAVVTVADDGGSSGRLRQGLGGAPPGDARNCPVARPGRRRRGGGGGGGGRRRVERQAPPGVGRRTARRREELPGRARGP